MNKEAFKIKIFEVIDAVLDTLKGEMLFKLIKPIIKPAKMALVDYLEKEPEQIIKWLRQAKIKIDEAIAIYEGKE